MPRPKGRGAARQNKRKDSGLKSAWAEGRYHGRDDGSDDDSSEGSDAVNKVPMRQAYKKCSGHSYS